MTGMLSRLLTLATASGLAFLSTLIPPALVGTHTTSLSLEHWRVGEPSVAWAAPSGDAWLTQACEAATSCG